MNDIEPITSRTNQKLIDARRVRDGKDRTKIFIEGKRLVEETLKSRVEILECFISTGLNDGLIVKDLKKVAGGQISYVDAKIFSSIADTENSQGLIVIAKRPIPKASSLEITSLPVALYLHEINNPSNLGAVLRTAEAAGVATVLISNNSADAFSPKTLRASMGAAFRLNVVENANISDTAKLARKNNFQVTAADVSAKRPYTDSDWAVPRLLVIGSEAHGLSTDELALADDLVRIEMSNNVESLNLAVSVGVILFEAKRQNA